MTPSRGFVAATAMISFAIVGAACSSGPDYEALEESITTEVDSSFASFDTEATSVECPEQESLDVGDEFTCIVNLTDLDGDMRVLVEVVSDDLDIEFSTIDLLYDMREVETTIGADLTEQVDSEVTVDCGAERLQAIEGGASFVCTATDSEATTATVDVLTDDEGTITWTVTPDET